MENWEKIVGGLLGAVASFIGILIYFEKWKRDVIKRGILESPEVIKMKEEHDDLKRKLSNMEIRLDNMGGEVDDAKRLVNDIIKDLLKLIQVR